MSNMERFTAYISVAERQKLRDVAREHGTSENYVLRMALRNQFGMPVPTYAANDTADRAERV